MIEITRIAPGHTRGKQRVYCPSCGEVRGSEQYSRPKNSGPVVYGHTRMSVGAEPLRCPGGPVDLEKDIAP